MTNQPFTVRIGNVYGHAQLVTMPAIFTMRKPIEYPLVNGPPKWYFGPTKLRQFNCTLTIYGTNKDILSQLGSIVDKVVPFISTYIGSFNCVVDLQDGPVDGSPNVWKTKVSIQEVV